MLLGDLETPALVVDRARVQQNTAAMAERAATGGVALRPHMKTAKSAAVAKLATANHSGAVTVSTLAEAEYLAEHGFRDFTYAVCAVPEKLDRAARLQKESGAQIQLITDSVEAARALAGRARDAGETIKVLVEIDSGEHRTGLSPDSPSVVETARAIHEASHLDLEGVLTHAGHSYECHSIEDVKRVAEDERQAVVGAARLIRDSGLECRTISAGSTPTAVHAESFEGLTEIRPGVYVFFDIAQLGQKSCRIENLALSVLATVISHRPEHGRIIIDAGGIALSKDTSASALLDAGYGWVFDAGGRERIGDLRVAVADQEHGYVESSSSPDRVPFDRLPIGSRVRVFPNHACMTASAYDSYAVVHDGDEIVDRWDRIHGW